MLGTLPIIFITSWQIYNIIDVFVYTYYYIIELSYLDFNVEPVLQQQNKKYFYFFFIKSLL